MPFRPFRTAREIRSRPRWLLPFLIVAALGVAGFALHYPRTVNAVLEHLPPSASPEDQQEITAVMSGELLIRSLFLPVRLLAGWCAFAAALFMTCKAFQPREGIRFSQFLSLEIHAEAILMISPLLALAGLPALDVTAAVPWAQDFLVRALLATVNIFTLWYILVLTAGISVLCGYTKRTAFLIVAAMWALFTSLNLGVLNLLRQTFSFRV